MRRLAALALALVLAGPAGAQDLVARFTAYIAPADLRAADGRRLTEPWQVLARDRENVHALAVRQFADEPDPVFLSPEARAQLPALLAAGWIEPEARQILRRGRGIVHVQVFTDGRALHSVRVTSRRPGPYYPAPPAPRAPAAGEARSGPFP